MLRKLLPCLFASALVANADDSDWKLQPLKYNNPGLVVDLGVGLWAWPMPMDYDGDGDMDLLVACPDKPSNGVYYFENPTQDPKVKMPVFKPGVRIGGASHNFQISYVDGMPRILRPGYEFPRDEKTGKFAFDKAKKIYPRVNIHENNVRANMWRYVDYDGDGDHDLIVGAGDWTDYGWDHAYDSHGRWRNGPLHGYVYLISNNGTDAEPKYSDKPEMLTAGGGEIDVYGWPSPNFADFDGDGDLDLLCGEFLDGFTYFENLGFREDPDYAAGRKLIAADGNPLVMDLQMITPTAIDWDGDGDLDLIVGDEDGRVALIENTRFAPISDGIDGPFEGKPPRVVKPVFRQPVYFKQEADTLKFGALATPFAFDWDQDGDEDILCGNTAGYIGIFENLGPQDSTNALPKWSQPKLMVVSENWTPRTEESWSLFGVRGELQPYREVAGSRGSIQGPCEAKWGYTTFSVVNRSLFVNNILGKIRHLVRGSVVPVSKNGDSANPLALTDVFPVDFVSKPAWAWQDPIFGRGVTQWRTTPIAIDWNEDERTDLIALDGKGFLSLWEENKPPNHIFIDEDNQPLQLNKQSAGRSGRVKLAVVDWDGDGRLDVLTNSENATWYRNCEDRDGKVVLKKIGNLAKRNVAGHTSSPAVCDFDKDGKPDLLVGSENGRIYHIKHDDCNQFPADQLKARAPKAKQAPKFPGFVREDFVFTRAKFPQCHASTICETTRGLVVAWFGGTKEKAKDVGIWVSYHDGGGWSSPTEWANGIQHDSLRHPCWNPVLFQPPGDAPTLLFFKVGPDPRTWWGEMMVSYDRGRTFRERKRLPEGIDGPVRCKPILLPDGKTLLSGSSTEYDGWRVHFEKTKLFDGQPSGTWKRIGPINSQEEFNAIQPTFLQHKGGKLQVLCRTKESVISTSFSEDGGETWSKMEATNLPNPNSGIENVTLKDGRHLLIYNHLGSGETGWGRRGMLNLAISDDGKVWKKVAVLEQEEKAEFSYPAIIQSDDGLVHMTYTWKRQRIKHVVIDPAKIQTGEVLGSEW